MDVVAIGIGIKKTRLNIFSLFILKIKRQLQITKIKTIIIVENTYSKIETDK